MKRLLSTIVLSVMMHMVFACTAGFTTTVSGSTASFSNTSTPPAGSGIYPQYYINYGDGNNGTNFANHTYATNGSYLACLTAIWYDSLNNNAFVCMDSFCATVTVGTPPPPTNTISGYLVIDSANCTVAGASDFKVWLITYDPTNTWLEAIDSLTLTGGNAHFVFNNEPNNVYRVKAMVTNNPSSGNLPIPTYGMNSLYWSSADSFSYTGGNSAGHDVFLVCSNTAATGPGFIGGDVNQGANKGTKTTGVLSHSVEMLITNTAGYKSYAMTGANGTYSFSNLPVPGTYTIYPEVIGYQTTPTVVTLSAATHTVNGIDFTVRTVSHLASPVTTSVNNIAKANNISIYPNPTTGLVNITSTEAATAVVSDVVGHKAMETAVKAGTSQLNISNLQPGVYFINIKGEGLNYSNKIVLQH